MERSVKILIVEDEVFIAKCMEIELKLAGYEICDSVRTGEEAIVAADRDKPDIALMDINLAGEMDGIQAAREIQKALGISIFFVTGYSDAETMERANQVGHIGYLQKPLRVSDVREIIESVFK